MSQTHIHNRNKNTSQLIVYCTNSLPLCPYMHAQRSFLFPELKQFLMRGGNPKDEYATVAEPLLQGEVGSHDTTKI